MKELGYTFSIGTPEGDESFSAAMEVTRVPQYLAQKKASTFVAKINSEIVMTADTVVILGNTILNKPTDRADAIRMLTDLSGKTHLVITAVCLLSSNKTICFDDRTEVTFNKLTLAQIEDYVDTHNPWTRQGATWHKNVCHQKQIHALAKKLTS